jgi:hypothetical protein
MRAYIDYIDASDEHARPFSWTEKQTKSRKSIKRKTINNTRLHNCCYIDVYVSQQLRKEPERNRLSLPRLV